MFVLFLASLDGQENVADDEQKQKLDLATQRKKHNMNKETNKHEHDLKQT